MSNKWRPEGWMNPHSNYGIRTKNHIKYDAYEAGADAMLEALRKQQTCLRLPANCFVHYHGLDEGGMEGSMVFIPDDEPMNKLS